MAKIWMHIAKIYTKCTYYCIASKCYNVNAKGSISLERRGKMFRALDIANYIIQKYSGKYEISNLKLQKLLYFVQGTYLATYQSPLFLENIVRWKYGPVVQEVYRAFRMNIADDIKLPTSDEKYDDIKNESRASMIIEQVMEQYGGRSAIALVEITHAHQPWIDTKMDCIIPKLKIQRYFEQILSR